MKRKSSELWVGIFIVVGIALLVLMTLRIGNFRLGKEVGYRHHVYFDAAPGLDSHSQVRVAGVRVGSVERLALEQGKAKVTFRVPSDINLYKDAKAYIKSEGILGEKYVEIFPGTQGHPKMEPDGVVEQGAPPMDIDQILSKVLTIEEDIRGVTSPLGNALRAVDAKKVEGIMDNFSKFSGYLTGIAGDLKQTMEKVQEAFSRLEEIGDKVRKGEGTLGKLITDDTIYHDARKTMETAKEAADSVKKTVDVLKNVSERIERGEGTLGKITKDESLYQEAVKTVETLKNVSQKIEQGEGTIGKLIKDESLYQEAKKTMETLRNVSEKIEQGEGTIGKLIKDESLYQDVRDTVQSAKETMKSANEALQSVKGIAEKVERGEGTLGKLVNDDKLMKETEKTLKKVQKAAEGIEEQTPITVLGTIIGIFF